MKQQIRWFWAISILMSPLIAYAAKSESVEFAGRNNSATAGAGEVWMCSGQSNMQLIAVDGDVGVKFISERDEESEQKIGQILEKLRGHHDRIWKERLAKEIEEITKVAELGEVQKKALEEISGKALEQSWADFHQNYSKVVRTRLETKSGPGLEALLREVGNGANWESLAAAYQSVYPNNTEFWKDALKQNLTVEQMARLEKFLAARWEARKADYSAQLDELQQSIRNYAEGEIKHKVWYIDRVLDLSDERRGQLHALAQRALDQSVKAWRQRAQKHISQFSDEHLATMSHSRALYGGMEPILPPDQQSAWKDGLKKLLSAQEIERFDDAVIAGRNRCLSVFGQVLVTTMEEAVTFTNQQREQLQELAQRLILQDPVTNDFLNSPGFYVAAMFRPIHAVAAQTRQEDLAKILDPQQVERWQKASRPNEANFDQDPNKEGLEQVAVGLENADAVVSDILYKRYHKERERVLEGQMLMVEELGRVIQLDAETLNRLKLAAQGQTDAVMRIRRRDMEQRVRSQLAGVTTEKELLKKLQSMEDYYIGGGYTTERVPAYIQKIVDSQFDGVMKSAWAKVFKTRETNRNRTIASVIVLQLDQEFSVTSEQWTKLVPLVCHILEEYGQDIQGMFTSSRPNQWCQETDKLYYLLGWIPAEEFKEILGEKKGQRWRALFSEKIRECWEEVQRCRELRLKQMAATERHE